MFLVGLTGGIASGKSTISTMLAKLGAEVIDADVVAREVVEPGTQGLKEVIAEFGEEIIQPDGSLSRAALAEQVFADLAKRTKLEAILHPLIKQRTMQLIAQSKKSIVVYVVPLLVEAKVDYPFDLVITVESGVANQMQRLKDSRGLTEGEAQSRIHAQASEIQRVARADIRLDGSVSLSELEAEVSKLWELLVKKAEAKATNGKN
jgi:dephospho-CoA kinase